MDTDGHTELAIPKLGQSFVIAAVVGVGLPLALGALYVSSNPKGSMFYIPIGSVQEFIGVMGAIMTALPGIVLASPLCALLFTLPRAMNSSASVSPAIVLAVILFFNSIAYAATVEWWLRRRRENTITGAKDKRYRHLVVREPDVERLHRQ